MNAFNKFKNLNVLSLFLVLSLVGFVGFSCGDDDDDDDDDGYMEDDDDAADDDDAMDDDDDNLDDDDSGDDDDDDDEPLNAYIRAIHLSPDAPNVDVYVNGAILAFEDLSFEESSEYAALEEGTYTFDITGTGGSVDDSVLTIADLALTGNTYYTAVAYDLLAAPITALALVDDYEGLEEGNIRIRAVHTAAGVGEVDIWVIPDEVDPFILFEDLGFGQAADYADVPAAAYTLGIDVDDDEVPNLIFEVPALAEGTVANVFAIKVDDDVLLLAQFEDGSVALINSNPPV